MKNNQVLGIDIGGSGIKGAPVDVKTGELLSERYRIPTPPKAKVKDVVSIIGKIAAHFSWKGPIGVGFPGVVQQGVVKTAANLDKGWVGQDAVKLISKETGCPVAVLNDADSAALAELKFGAGKDSKGVVLLLTIGTGIGTVLFTKKKLVANMELGHVYMPGGQEAEPYCSDATRKKEELSWEQWGKRFNEYLVYMENLLWPELIIVGGGVSKKMDLFSKQIKTRTPVKPALLLNEAGLVGAALSAKKL